MWRALSLDGNIWNFIQDFFELFENLKENFLFEVGCRGLDSFGLSHFLIQGKVSQEIEIRLKLTKLQEGFYLHFEILGKFRLWDEWFIRFIISFLSSSFSHFFTSLKIRILYIYIYICVCVCETPSPRDLNSNSYLPHPTNTYTSRVIIAYRVCSDTNLCF